MRVDYDQLIDEFSVDLGIAEEIDATELLDDLFVGFDHAQEGRLVTLIAVSPSLGKSTGWQEVLHELLGDSLWHVYQEAQRQGLPIRNREYDLPSAEESALREGPWRLHHRWLRLQLDDPIHEAAPVPSKQPARPRPRLRLGGVAPATGRSLASEPNTPGPPGSNPEISVRFSDLADYGYGNRATLAWVAHDHLRVSLMRGEDPQPLLIQVSQPAGVEGQAHLQPESGGRFVADIQLSPGITADQLRDVRLVASPADV